MQLSNSSLTIGALAAAAGVHVETVRYYQRRGLITEPVRPRGGVRRYSADDADRLRFIKRAQAMGFALAEVAIGFAAAVAAVRICLQLITDEESDSASE